MTRASFYIGLFLLIPIGLSGQCVNPPTLRLSSTSGTTCGIAPFAVSGNTFGGSATRVTISENGTGTVSPGSSSTSPFTFTYTPKSGDYGKNVIITITTNNPLGKPCSEAKATYTLAVNAVQSAPVAGTITSPTCIVATGSVLLSGLPSSGTWTLTRSPGGVTTTGTGTSTTVTGLASGTYTFTVTNAAGCTSAATSGIVIPAQPASPASPVQTVDCSLGYGKAVVRITSPVGTGLTYCLDGGTYQSGTSFSNVTNGNHSITVRNAAGCTTTGSGFQVSCGCLNPPTVTLSTRSGTTCGILPVTVTGNSFGGSATSVTITENGAGSVSPASSNATPFSFTYTPASGDSGNTIVITVTTNNPLDFPCTAAVATYTLRVIAYPSAPIPGTIIQPTCNVSTGSVVLNGLPGTGTWILTRYPGMTTTTGTGTSTTVTDLPGGVYNFSVTNETGCISAISANVTIPAQPVTPSPPLIGTITQPTPELRTGSVILSGLPSIGTWILSLIPGNIITTGTGTTHTISGLSPGTYNFIVANSGGCTSGLSASFVIYPVQGTPVLLITNPAAVCFPSTVDITDPKVTAGSDLNLVFTYWSDEAATIQYRTPGAATNGTWYIKGTTANGQYSIKPVAVHVLRTSAAHAGPDQILSFQFETTMDAIPADEYDKSIWSVISGSGEFFDPGYARTIVSGLSLGKNLFLWTISNGVCPSASDSVEIMVQDLLIPTLITPNMDGKNDFLIINQSDILGRIELVIFNRRGVQVFKSGNYDNQWNGVDDSGKLLSDDTYFYVFKSENHKPVSGFIVIRR
jgi:gliding motility-associated-like protein